MTNITPVVSPKQGEVGKLHEIEVSKDSVFVFQLNRNTNDLNPAYVAEAKATLANALPEGARAIIIGRDVNLYELAGADAVMLILRGVI